MLDHIERAGNRLPDPVFIFIGLCGIILLASWLGSATGLSAVHPATGKTETVTNLIDGAGLVRILEQAATNFAEFPPLGLVLTVMIGVGVAERSGWFDTLMRSAVSHAPQALIIPIIIFIGILGNLAGDSASIVLPPIAAMIFIRLGFHPVAGLACAYAATEGAFAANLMLGLSDVLALSFTEPAARIINDRVSTHVAMNYYFIATSTLLLLPVAWWVTLRVVVPRMGHWQPGPNSTGQAGDAAAEVTARERNAMRAANLSLLALIVILLCLCLPADSLLRNPETGSLINDSPLINGIIPIITLLLLIPGIVYGRIAGTARRSRDIARMMGDSMAAMGTYIVIVFFAAQMLAFFKSSNLGTIIAIKGAALLAGQSGITLIVGIVILSASINLLIGSASAKWAILAPIFVPMMMLLDYHPAFTQMVYRVGDSITNPITPMLPYMALLVSYAQRYVKDIRMGTLIAALMPYTIAFGIFWTLMLVVWYLAGWPVGPGGPIHFQPAG
ncbi:MAG: AbgT family transporter [Lautropia sp.]|nr:AbgT family transporter [Lautropia sp.]